MALIKFTGNWSKAWQDQFKIPKGYLIIKPKGSFIKKMGIGLNQLQRIQDKKQKLKDVDVTIEIHYKKRTIDQNNLAWALYTIEANEMNAGIQGSKSQMVTPEELYNNDLLDYAPRIKIQAKEAFLSMIKSEYRVIEEKETEHKGLFVLTVILTSSKFNTKQMAEWIERIFNRMAANGVSINSSAEILDYWTKWRQGLNDEKIILHDDILSGQEYKALNPICEATGDYIGNGHGQLCHIQARGMGGNPEEEKDYSSNWLHLSTEAHIAVQHQKGWSYFLKLYPHLKYKVETALRREYKDSSVELVKETFEGVEV